MLTLLLSQIAQICQGTVHGNDCQISSFSTDSRHIAPEELFVALKGERFDGHHYLPQAVANGAGAALVSLPIESKLSYVLVDDTRIALGQIASWQRQQFQGPVAAITGSNGKTTVKEMLSFILASHYQVLFTQGNFNNDIGLPLTLLRLQPHYQAMVLELGANHAGEIAYTAKIAHPNVALVNNVGDAHIEGFGSRDGVAHEKSEILAALQGQGCAVFESDSPYQTLFRQKAGTSQCVTFGLDDSADVQAQDCQRLKDGCYQFSLCFAHQSAPVVLKTAGLHNVKNSCAAAAMALQMGVELAVIARQLSEFLGVAGRLRRLKLAESMTLFDDTYNANPASFMAALEVLVQSQGRAILVAGDMGELGEQSLFAHQQLGRAAAKRQIELMATGTWMKQAVATAGHLGQHYPDQPLLAQALLNRLEDIQQQGCECVVVVKGSRASQMENVVQFIQQHFNKVHQC
ncbi:UDP-N-acetylmuramoyl-tripeptide--D-alanyl-D-alanine ligase [Celerinatantimonas yamalensis]|uniref:UDP-N-acetylmuramoyl-tripeptide--D-alanyl-D-alanine ligase n=1 Tax=Celerinatantimonas yamalensis TaxID=559956 RepID=A0ABW9G5C9_9GAMM